MASEQLGLFHRTFENEIYMIDRGIKREIAESRETLATLLEGPILLFEELYSKKLLESGGFPASILWLRCKKLQKSSPRFCDRNTVIDSMFSIFFYFYYKQLIQTIIPGEWIRNVINDRLSFENRAYEIQVAAHFEDAGYLPSFTNDNGIADIKFNYKDDVVFVECKRKTPLTREFSDSKSVGVTFLHACSQIPDDSLGIICIEIVPPLEDVENYLVELDMLITQEWLIMKGEGQTNKRIGQVALSWIEEGFYESTEALEAISFSYHRHVKVIDLEPSLFAELKTLDGDTIELHMSKAISGFRISGVDRSFDWIKLTHENLAGNLITYGPEETSS